MSMFVEEIMNRELFSVSPDERANDVLSYVLSLGLSGTPVLDGDGKPVGMISLRDLIRHPGELVGERMKKPVACVGLRSTIESAARLMSETGYHRLVVVDEDGRAVGILSTVDALAGLTGVPVRHPAVFPHYDAAVGVSWSDPRKLCFDRVEAAPESGGVIMLERNEPGHTGRTVWAEAAGNMRKRLIDMLSVPREQPPVLSHWLREGSLEFRTAGLNDAAARGEALERLREQLGPFGGSRTAN